MSKTNHLKLYKKFVSEYKAPTFIGIILFSIHAGLETFTTGSIYPLINKLINPNQKSAIEEGKVLTWLNDLGEILPFDDKIIASAILVLVFSIMSSILGFCSEFFAKYYQLKLYKIYKDKVFKIVMNQKMEYFSDKKQGELIFLATNIALSAGEFFVYFPKTVIELLRIVAFSAFLFSISFKATAFLFIFVGILGVIYILVSSKVIYPRSVLTQKYMKQGLEIFTECLSGIKEIKLMNAFDFFFKKFSHTTQEEKSNYLVSSFFTISLRRAATALSFVIISVVIIVLKKQSSELFFQVIPIVMVYMLAIQKMVPAVYNMGTNWMGMKELTPRLEKLYEVLSDERKIEVLSGEIISNEYKEISVSNLDFAYNDIDKVLSGIQMIIPRNSSVALVGESGSGKSTLMNLFSTSLYDSNSSISIGKQKLNEISFRDWRNHFSIVSQENFLFHASIEENIRMGKPDATKEEVIEAAKMAHAHEFIVDQEEGYNTVLGDRGLKLSGGQRQRIAIARALIRKPSVLFLDEATSALDNTSENYIKQTLEELKGSMTIVTIAHRLSTIVNSDYILMMDGGRIVERGSHQELLGLKGKYCAQYMLMES